MNRRLTPLLLALVALTAAATATAQPLADRVPADALLYVGWTGADSMGPGFEGSHFKAIAEAAEVPRILNEILPKLLERIVQEEPDARDPINLVRPILESVWRHPTALYVGPVDLSNPERPVPKLALLCEAGEHAGEMERQLENALRQAGRMPFEAGVRTVGGNVVVLTVGNATGIDAVVEGRAKEKALGAAKNFTSAMSMQKSPVVAAYVDAEAIVKLIDEAVAKTGGDGDKKDWPRARDALGLNGLKRIAFAQGFDGKDWGTHALIEAPAPRSGLFAALDAKPVSDEALRAIPASATMAGVARVDLGGIFDKIRDAVRKLDERGAREMEDGIKELNDMLGMDVRKDLLGTFGDEWAYFISPEMTGHGPLGVVIVNRVKDGKKAIEASDKLRDLANKVIEKENRDPDVRVEFKQTKADGVTVNYLATPFVTPSWSIQGSNLFIGLYPQSVVPAAGHASREGKSILDNPEFVALRKRLGGEGRAVSFQFYDLPKSAPTAYQFWMVAHSVAKFGDLIGVDTPLMLLPPLAKVREHLTVAGSVSWVDEKGWHFRGVSPFPGATMLASETAGLLDAQAVPLLASITLPAMVKARAQAQQVQGLSNLRQMGMGLHVYAVEHKGVFPDKLSEILPYVDNNVALFVNPRRGQAPPSLAGKEAADWVDRQSDYVYVLPGRKQSEIRNSFEVIAIHEKPVPGQGISAVFADGHAETMPPSYFEQVLARQKEAEGDAPKAGEVKPPAE